MMASHRKNLRVISTMQMIGGLEASFPDVNLRYDTAEWRRKMDKQVKRFPILVTLVTKIFESHNLIAKVSGRKSRCALIDSISECYRQWTCSRDDSDSQCIVKTYEEAVQWYLEFLLHKTKPLTLFCLYTALNNRNLSDITTDVTGSSWEPEDPRGFDKFKKTLNMLYTSCTEVKELAAVGNLGSDSTALNIIMMEEKLLYIFFCRNPDMSRANRRKAAGSSTVTLPSSKIPKKRPKSSDNMNNSLFANLNAPDHIKHQKWGPSIDPVTNSAPKYEQPQKQQQQLQYIESPLVIVSMKLSFLNRQLLEPEAHTVLLTRSTPTSRNVNITSSYYRPKYLQTVIRGVAIKTSDDDSFEWKEIEQITIDEFTEDAVYSFHLPFLPGQDRRLRVEFYTCTYAFLGAVECSVCRLDKNPQSTIVALNEFNWNVIPSSWQENVIQSLKADDVSSTFKNMRLTAPTPNFKQRQQQRYRLLDLSNSIHYYHYSHDEQSQHCRPCRRL